MRPSLIIILSYTLEFTNSSFSAKQAISLPYSPALLLVKMMLYGFAVVFSNIGSSMSQYIAPPWISA